MKRTKLPQKLPKCACGCGKRVRKKGNRFLYGHNLLLPLCPQKEKERRHKISETMKSELTKPEVRQKRYENSWKSRPHSEETKKKLSILRTGAGNGMFGKKLSQEHIAKIRKSREGYRHSEETKRKIGQSNKKNKPTEEQRKQISKTLKQYFLTHPNPFKGKKHTPEARQKMSVALKGVYQGEKPQTGKEELVVFHMVQDGLLGEVKKFEHGITINVKIRPVQILIHY